GPARLLHRPGDEADRRQRRPARGQRAAAREARRLSSDTLDGMARLTLARSVVLCVVASASLAWAAAGAADTAPTPPVPWQVVKDAVNGRQASFTKSTAFASAPGKPRHVALRVWYAYDSAMRLVEWRIGLGDDPETPKVEPVPGRSSATLRFVSQHNRLVMWN